MLHINKIPAIAMLVDIGDAVYLPNRSASADSGYLQ